MDGGGFLPTQTQELCYPRIPSQGLILVLVMGSDPSWPRDSYSAAQLEDLVSFA